MTTPVKVTNKIDDFAIEISIADISSLTKGLLQLQHARYPHLVPMYRTVHRTKPRAMVLSAIRWVNPNRMFPGAGKTRAEMEGMSSDDLEKLIVDLNGYRGEAHVIHNRYNQMIDLINMGELPYFIPYAGFKQDKWEMLQEYMDRAQRLKDGTEEWENVLDHQALEIRNILLKREGADKRRLDDIEGLWVDAKGEAAAPNFMDVKKGKEKKIALRANRISADGKRVKHRQKIYVRRFIAVDPQEQRPGEVMRLPAGGQVRRPGRDNPTARKIFDEHGGAAEHLVRMPRGWAQGTDNPELREKGNMITMPPGRKDPRILTFAELDFDAVANRREARWTQPDPLGKRGQARHRGAASQVPGGHGGEEELEERRQRMRGNIRQRQQMLDERRRRRQQADRDAGRGQGQQVDHTEKVAQAVKINQEFNEAAVNLLDQYGIDQTNLNKMANIKAENVERVTRMGGGVNADEGFVLMLQMKDGSKYAYKIVPNEQKSEVVANTIDKIFGLAVASDTVQFNSIDAPTLKRLGAPTGLDELQLALEMGGGHLQAFCEPNCMDANKAHDRRGEELYGSVDYRGDLHRMAINDWLTGNWDRHTKNWMVTEDGRAVQIDTGFGLGVAQIHDNRWDNIEDRGNLFDSPGNFRTPHVGRANDIAGGKDVLKQELEAVFDHHVTKEKINELQQAFGLNNRKERMSIEELKKDFMTMAERMWGERLGEPSPIGDVQFDGMERLFGGDVGGGGAPERQETGTSTRDRDIAEEIGADERSNEQRRRERRGERPTGVPAGVSGFTPEGRNETPGMMTARDEGSSQRGGGADLSRPGMSVDSSGRATSADDRYDDRLDFSEDDE